MRVTGKRLRVNVMSAVASRGALWFTVFTERFTAAVFTAFLDRVARQAGRKVHVVADRHPVRRSKAVRAWLKTNADRVELHLRPGYSPELNPGELRGADLKHNVNASRAHNADRLAHETRRLLRRRQRQPHIVRSYFQAPHVRYAIMQATEHLRLNRYSSRISANMSGLSPRLGSGRPWNRGFGRSNGRHGSHL